MKKITRAAICLVTAMPALSYASGNVTLFGIIDTSIEVSNVGNGTVARMDSGGQLGSRFGLKGTEDIGGGNTVNFMLEQGIGSNDGTAANPTLAFSRQAWVGMAGTWGEFRVGLQNSPVYIYVNGYLDAFTVATIGSAQASFQTLIPRSNNAIFYQTPRIAGLVAQFMIGLRDQTTKPMSGAASYHIGIEYDRGPVSAATGFQRLQNATNSSVLEVFTVGASYAFGPVRLYVGLNNARQSDGSLNKNAYTTSLAWTINPASQLSFGIGHASDRTSADNDGNQIGMMYWYFLSKRDTLYFSAAFLKNMHKATYTMNGATTVGIPVAYAGADARGIQFGIQHRF